MAAVVVLGTNPLWEHSLLAMAKCLTPWMLNLPPSSRASLAQVLLQSFVLFTNVVINLAWVGVSLLAMGATRFSRVIRSRRDDIELRRKGVQAAHQFAKLLAIALQFDQAFVDRCREVRLLEADLLQRCLAHAH